MHLSNLLTVLPLLSTATAAGIRRQQADSIQVKGGSLDITDRNGYNDCTKQSNEYFASGKVVKPSQVVVFTCGGAFLAVCNFNSTPP